MVDNVIKPVLDAVPSPRDERDYRYSQSKAALRNSVDLREWDSAVDDQKSTGSCVGNAIVNAYELTVRRLYPNKFIDLSRLFVYYNSRLFDNSIREDVGTYVRDGLRSATRYGICSESLWPYVEGRFNSQPNPDCYVDATQRTITRYETLYSLGDVLEILNDHRPVVVGITVYAAFMDLNATNAVVPLPLPGERPIGSHAVVLVGYDLPAELFLVKNSFGPDWGDHGYFRMPFEYLRTEAFEKWCFDINCQSTI